VRNRNLVAAVVGKVRDFPARRLQPLEDLSDALDPIPITLDEPPAPGVRARAPGRTLSSNPQVKRMKLLMIDNYDSFTYNIVQYLGELGAQVQVARNDEITLEGIAALAPERLVISPGPCSPAEAGISLAAIRHFAGKLPILGVCLGHQAIGAAFGARVIRAQTQMHGKTSVITTDQKGVFAGLPRQFTVNRYHSLVIERQSLPPELIVSATSEDGEIQGVRHASLPVEGVQFHPESILTEHGHALLKNFLYQKQ
jgi:anthranilate synthase component 2